MTSKAQIKARENFVKNYAGKNKLKGIKKSPKGETLQSLARRSGKGSSNIYKSKSGNKTDIRLKKLKAKKQEKYGNKKRGKK